MSNYLIHVTLTTGHMSRHQRNDTEDAAIAAVSDLLDGILQGGAVEIPGRPGYYATGRHADRSLIVTLWAGHPNRDGLPILTSGVVTRSRASRRLWALLHDQATAGALATDPDKPPSAPWVADRIEPGALDHMDAMRWTGSWARCLGWAWLEYDR